MSISVDELGSAVASSVLVTEASLNVSLSDGRTLTVPLPWFPRLLHATPVERQNWRLLGHGESIHWPDLDEDISVMNLLLGKRSGESQRSLERWLERRPKLSQQS